jgi:carnitine 3-dehydrogenase
LAGGERGMRHFMSQFGPALKWPWTKLVAPELTDELLDRIVEQSDEQAGKQKDHGFEGEEKEL